MDSAADKSIRINIVVRVRVTVSEGTDNKLRLTLESSAD